MENFIFGNDAVSTAFNFWDFCLDFSGVIILTLLVKEHYRRYFPVFSRSQSMERTLVAIGIITFVVISVVKSSLALSLGLVGALSIIRFRTPIKEPFELAYIFLVIAIGLGFGAGQTLAIITVTIVLLFILYLQMRKSDVNDNDLHFIYLTLSKTSFSGTIQENLSIIDKNVACNIMLRRLDQSEETIQLTLCANLNSMDQLIELTDELNRVLMPSNLSIVDGQKIMPF